MRTAAPVCVAAGALALSIGLSGCDNASVTAPTTAPSVAPSGSSTPAATTPTAGASAGSGTAVRPTMPTATGADPALAAGQCTRQEPQWTRLACTAEHTYEVTAVVPSTAHQDDMLKRHEAAVATCERKGAEYLGSTALNTTRFRSVTYPIAKDPKAATRFICLIGMFDEGFGGVTQVTGSSRGRLAGTGAYDLRACIAEKIAARPDVSPASCSAPHTTETVGGGIIGQPADPYPGEAEAEKRTSALCAPLYRAFVGAATKPRADIGMVTVPPARQGWSAGSRRATCWVELRAGRTTATLRGIGDKPVPTA
ncbi:septum formation family protein [Luteipulveratus sp. YIM 133132]|uniref:septum formation family protein n=1 Tax=Luteipulveratus flavus TaxID=3031728 RepID=UPI0023AF2287|nr:septum formation family protein [Luteipulveratus sp. YIM 133132]MDE9366355.1 septum formation family protein [Luteipulveratus sp. YIM 133132]